MRSELYADSRDEWKWSVSISQARGNDQSIFWVVMLRPTVGQHGKDRESVCEALPEVTRFFEAERAQIDQGQPKSLARMVNLCSQFRIELFVDMEAYPAALERRGRYVSNIVHALEARQKHLKHLVLLDPDNGIGEAKTNGQQIHVTHVQRIWSALRKGDTLAIVQFQHHIENWVTALQNRLTEILGIKAEQIRCRAWANISVYLVDR